MSEAKWSELDVITIISYETSVCFRLFNRAHPYVRVGCFFSWGFRRKSPLGFALEMGVTISGMAMDSWILGGVLFEERTNKL